VRTNQNGTCGKADQLCFHISNFELGPRYVKKRSVFTTKLTPPAPTEMCQRIYLSNYLFIG